MQRFKILWYKFRAKAISSIVNLFASQSNYDIKNTVLLIGTTRSGTTFLMESLNSKNEYRLIFEPFNPTYTEEWSSFSPRHYINPLSIGEKERQAVDNILRGKIRNKWVDQYNKRIRSDKRLVKSVRANLMIDYLENQYPDLLIIYIYRNPYDLVASRINLNFDPDDVKLILAHKDFIDSYYPDIDVGKLKSMLSSPESFHTALWCFENRFLLRNPNPNNRSMRVIKFDEIVDKSVSLVNNEIIESKSPRQPSVTTSFKKQYKLSHSEIKNITQVLSFFGMKEFIKKS